MTFIIGLAVKSLVVAGLTLALLRLFRNASAAQRSWLAHAGLGALLLMPVVAMLLPALEVPERSPMARGSRTRNGRAPITFGCASSLPIPPSGSPFQNIR